MNDDIQKKFLIPSEYLRALLLLAAKKDVRYYLNAIYIERKGKFSFLVATDGHRLGVARIEALPFRKSLIIPRESIKLALSSKDPMLPIRKVGSQWSLGGILFDPIDGKYPDWRAVIPKSINFVNAQFNNEYLGDLVRIGKIISPHRTIFDTSTLACNGDRAAVATFNDPNFLVLIMPMRKDELHPCWHKFKIEKPEDKAA